MRLLMIALCVIASSLLYAQKDEIGGFDGAKDGKPSKAVNVMECDVM